jgi:hypothetical protein
VQGWGSSGFFQSQAVALVNALKQWGLGLKVIIYLLCFNSMPFLVSLLLGLSCIIEITYTVHVLCKELMYKSRHPSRGEAWSDGAVTIIAGSLRIFLWNNVQYTYKAGWKFYIYKKLKVYIIKPYQYNIIGYNRVGGFLTKIWFWMKVPLEYIHFYEKVPKIATKKSFFWPSDLLRKGHSLRGQALYKFPILFIFFIIWGLWASKDA